MKSRLLKNMMSPKRMSSTFPHCFRRRRAIFGKCPGDELLLRTSSFRPRLVCENLSARLLGRACNEDRERRWTIRQQLYFSFCTCFCRKITSIVWASLNHLLVRVCLILLFHELYVQCTREFSLVTLSPLSSHVDTRIWFMSSRREAHYMQRSTCPGPTALTQCGPKR